MLLLHNNPHSCSLLYPVSKLLSTKKKCLYTWGKQSSSLGYKCNSQSQKLPKKVAFPDESINVRKVCMGPTHSAVITESGQLFTFGENHFGCLGSPTPKIQPTPVLIPFFSSHSLNLLDIHCGEKHTVALTDDGDVWSWGYNGKK